MMMKLLWLLPTPNMPPSVLAKRKHDDGAGVSGRNKLKAIFIPRVLKQASGLMPGSTRPSLCSTQGPPSVSLVVASALSTLPSLSA